MKKSIFRATIVMLMGLIRLQQSQAQSPTTVVLDDFKSGVVRIINPQESDPAQKYQWSQHPSCSNAGTPCKGVLSVIKSGDNHSLRDEVTQGNAYLQFFTYSNARRGWGYMHDFLTSGTWATNYYNRMRFWIKVPADFPQVDAKQHNLEFGTFERAASYGDWHGHEDGGGHWYHFFNIPATSEWYQIIVDTHPSHQRGGSGATEWGDRLHVTGEQNWNYFDALTSFYLDFYNNGYVLPTVPGDFYFGRFELYQETNPVNIQQVYSLGGVYVPGSNRIHVGWQHEKGDGATCHEVRYAWQDIFTLGWAKATIAPSGKVCPDDAVYSGMAYDSTAINVSGHNEVYIAIKPANSNRFNQIQIPVSSSSATLPTAEQE